MLRRLAVVVALFVVALSVFGAASFADDEKSSNACPRCGQVVSGEKCESDDAPVVSSGLVAFHNALLELGEGPSLPGGLDNPFEGCVKDGDVDVEALEKLVQDYKAARARTEFKKADLDLLGMKAARTANESAAIGALKTLATAEAIFREGDKDQNGVLDYGSLKALGKTKLIDDKLASGEKQGYKFRCHPSTDKDKCCFCWWATAMPLEPGKTGKRYFFTNQTGVIYYSKKPFKIDDTIKESCEVPDGLKPVGR